MFKGFQKRHQCSRNQLQKTYTKKRTTFIKVPFNQHIRATQVYIIKVHILHLTN